MYDLFRRQIVGIRDNRDSSGVHIIRTELTAQLLHPAMALVSQLYARVGMDAVVYAVMAGLITARHA